MGLTVTPRQLPSARPALRPFPPGGRGATRPAKRGPVWDGAAAWLKARAPDVGFPAYTNTYAAAAANHE